MPENQILIESIINSADPGVVIGNLDAPTANTTLHDSMLTIKGWVYGPVSPVGTVMLFHNGDFLTQGNCRIHRPDVLAHLDITAAEGPLGFEVSLNTTGIDPRFDIEIWSHHVDGRKEHWATLKGTRTIGVETPWADRTPLNPIMLTSLGRTGTTWLMRCIQEHPTVICDPVFPYEQRPACYWMHAFQVLSQPANIDHSSDPDGFVFNPFVIGHNPYFRMDGEPTETAKRSWFANQYPQNLAAFCLDNIDQYYQMLQNAWNKKAALFFLEKCPPGHLPRLFRQFFPGAREIILVRDFRDMICSILAFNKKRALDGFGFQEGSDESAAIEEMAVGVHKLYRDWKSRADAVCLIKYEDLIQAPLETLAAVFDYLDIDNMASQIVANQSQIMKTTPQLGNHKTARSAHKSIGRWRSELPPSMVRVCEQRFGEALNGFGYTS